MSNWQNVINKVSKFAAEHSLIQSGDQIILAVSGGPDSVCLVEIMSELALSVELKCHLAHVNYGVRGADATADQKFCQDLAADKKWPIDVLTVSDDERDQSKHENFQEWARIRRYEFFGQVATQYSNAKVAVAHHLDDQVETFLLRLLRGSGLTGLAAMRPLTELAGCTIIRPLLSISKDEILSALAERKHSYREDASNESTRYRRNRLRKEVLPLLAEIQPAYQNQVGEALMLMQGDDSYLEERAQEALDQLRLPESPFPTAIKLSRKKLQELPTSLRLRVIRRAIGQLTGGPQSITFHHVRKIEELVRLGPNGAQYDLPGKLLFEQGPLVVTLIAESD